MALILIPRNGEDVKINAWNWRPTLELLRKANLIDDDLYERMGRMGTSGRQTIVDLVRPSESLISSTNIFGP